MLERMYKKRLKTYAKLGYQVVVPSEGDAGTGRFVEARDAVRLLSDDIASARKSVLIAAPYAMTKTVEILLPALEGAMRRGVSVSCCVTRDPGGDLVGKLRAAGVEVSVGSDAALKPGLAVFDEELVWYGSLPLLAFAKSDDCSVRFGSAEVAYELLHPDGD